MPISSFTGSVWPVLLLDGVTFSGAYPCLFFNHVFSITPGVHRTNLCCNSIRTQRGRSSGWDSRALYWDSWVTGVSLGPQSTQWLLCTCQSSCDTDSPMLDMGVRLKRRARWEVLNHGAVSHQQVTPTLCLEKTSHNNKKGRAAGYYNTTVQCVGTDTQYGSLKTFSTPISTTRI